MKQLLILLLLTTPVMADQFEGNFLGTGIGYGTAQDLYNAFGIQMVEMATLTNVPGHNNGLSSILGYNYGGIWRYHDLTQPTVDLLVVAVDGEWAAYCYEDNPHPYPSKQSFLGSSVSLGTWSTATIGNQEIDHLTVFKGQSCTVPEPLSMWAALMLLGALVVCRVIGQLWRRFT